MIDSIIWFLETIIHFNEADIKSIRNEILGEIPIAILILALSKPFVRKAIKWLESCTELNRIALLKKEKDMTERIRKQNEK